MGVPFGELKMTDWSAVMPPPAVATAMLRSALPAPSKRVAAPANSGNTRNDAQDRQPPLPARVRHGVVVPPRPDEDRPTGPPPAFEANVLEAEAEKRRNRLAEGDNARNTGKRPQKPGANEPATGAMLPGTATGYGAVREGTAPTLDLMR